MKQIQFHRSGPPAEVARCVEVADPEISAPDDVLILSLSTGGAEKVFVTFET